MQAFEAGQREGHQAGGRHAHDEVADNAHQQGKAKGENGAGGGLAKDDGQNIAGPEHTHQHNGHNQGGDVAVEDGPEALGEAQLQGAVQRLAALQLLSVVKESGKTLAELASDVTTYPQELLNIKVADKGAAMQNDKLRAVIDEVETAMAGNGRVLVRPSGTEPLLRIMAEAPTKELVHQYVEKIGDVARAELEVE